MSRAPCRVLPGNRKVYEMTYDGVSSFIISENNCWRPGAYSTADLAEKAFEHDDGALKHAQQKARCLDMDDPLYGIITPDMLGQVAA